MEQWFDMTRKLFEPVAGSKKTGKQKASKAKGVEESNGNWFVDAYQGWLSNWSSFWRPSMGFFSPLGFTPDTMKAYFTEDSNRKTFEKMLDTYPTDQWSSMLFQSSKILENYIAFLKEVDLPFDEIAAFWDKWLVQFTPLDDVPLFRLGSDVHQHLETLVNPFYTFMGTPKLLKFIRLIRDIQFYYLSFILKNAELRSKLLEASLTVLPETVKALVQEYEQTKEVPVFDTFIQHYINTQEAYLHSILESDEYSTIQHRTAETGVKLKSKIEEFIELSLSGLPLMTRKDEDEIAKELESIRVKLRELKRDETVNVGIVSDN